MLGILLAVLALPLVAAGPGVFKPAPGADRPPGHRGECLPGVHVGAGTDRCT